MYNYLIFIVILECIINHDCLSICYSIYCDKIEIIIYKKHINLKEIYIIDDNVLSTYIVLSES